MEFPEGWGWGVQGKKNICRSGMDIFWNNTVLDYDKQHKGQSPYYNR